MCRSRGELRVSFPRCLSQVVGKIGPGTFVTMKPGLPSPPGGLPGGTGRFGKRRVRGWIWSRTAVLDWLEIAVLESVSTLLHLFEARTYLAWADFRSSDVG